MITKTEIDYVNNTIPIENVLAHYGVEKSRNNKYYCPFGNHEDKHASLSVKKDKNICYCFACNTGGNVISLVQKLEGLPFSDALFKVESDFGITEFEHDHTSSKGKTVKDVTTSLPLTISELRFLGIEPYIKIYTYDPAFFDRMQEEIELLKEDYANGYTRQDVSLEELIKWTEDDYLHLYGKCETSSILWDYRSDPVSVVSIIQNKITEKYEYYSSLPISGKNELIREKIEKLQDKIDRLLYNKKYQDWCKRLYKDDPDFEIESNFEIENNQEVLER